MKNARKSGKVRYFFPGGLRPRPPRPGPLYGRTPPVGAGGGVADQWRHLAAGLDEPASAIGARMREDRDGFYAALREWLGRWEGGANGDAGGLPSAEVTPSTAEVLPADPLV